MNDAIKRLEEKIAFLEHHVTAQDKAMLEFADELARLRREVKQLVARLADAADTGAGDTDAPPERPPHY